MTDSIIDSSFTGRRLVWIGLAGLIAVAIGLRVLGLDHTLWIDEAGSLAQATAPDFWANARHDVHPPLFFVLLRLGLKATSSFVVLRLFSVACGLALVALAVLALRRSGRAALVGGLIVAALPEFIFHSQQLRPYAPLFLALGLALALAVREFTNPAGSKNRLALASVLILASALHLVTAFFLLALAPLLAWPAGRRGPRTILGALLPLLPAGLLLLWFKFGFVDQPSDLAEGWWMPQPNLAVIVGAVGESFGWPSIDWLADAASRHLPGGRSLVLLLAIIAAAFSLGTAWARRLPPLIVVLLLSSLVYLAAVVGYSYFSEPLIAPRTLLPGILPFAAALALGIDTCPRAWQRTAATGAVALYIGLTALPTARLALKPIAGLRGLAATARGNFQTGDLVILFRSMDYGLQPYWPGFSGSEPVRFNQTRPRIPQLSALRARLDRLAPGARIFVAFRDDHYLRQNRAALDLVLAELESRFRPARELWHENDLTLLLAAPPSP